MIDILIAISSSCLGVKCFPKNLFYFMILKVKDIRAKAGYSYKGALNGINICYC